jgi:DNA repair photolyase
VRWDALRPGEGAGPPGTLPLFGRGVVTRQFDTPEFRGTTFHEVHARSIVNRVPEASQLPFRWTINPYRGCSHACVYCLGGDTAILMGDGGSKPLSELRVGDEVYGTEGRGTRRRLVRTEVRAHWQTVKPAYRVTLDDGTRLVASADHRFLTRRGWKYVAVVSDGTARRPRLGADDRLLGTGQVPPPPVEDDGYRVGYVCGLVKAGGGDYDASVFRLELPDTEPLHRAQRYLAALDVPTAEFILELPFGAGDGRTAIRTASKRAIARIADLARWPVAPGASWRRGFLAGMFDAVGSFGKGALTIPHDDPVIMNQVLSCLWGQGFRYAVDSVGRAGERRSARILGGLREQVRFLYSVDPAAARKRCIAGAGFKGDAHVGLVSVEPLRMELTMYDITTGTGDFIANGVVSHNCFARNTHTFLDLDAGHDFDSQIVVKVNAAELLRKELAAPKWLGEPIAMGTNVDCYQRAEGRYRLMRGILAALRDAANPFSILTKGSLILRDLDLLTEAAALTDVGTAVSVGSVDRELWRLVEPGTPSPQKRLEVCVTLTGHGLRCNVLMAPILPGLTDSPAQLEATVRAIAEAGAARVSPIVLHMRPGAREWYAAWLRTHRPDLLPLYGRLYGPAERPRSYAPKAYQHRIGVQVAELAEKHGIGRGGVGTAAGWRRSVDPPTPKRVQAEQGRLL